MNNDLEQFSEEYLKDIQKHMALGMTLGHADVFLIRQLIDLALAAKQAKPVNSPCEKCKGSGFMDSGGTQPWGEPISVECDCTTPQPAHTERVIRDGWKLVPEEATIAMLTLLGMTGSFEFMQQKYKNMLAAAPKPDGTLISEGTKSDSCQWKRDEDSVYSTGCGNEWQFTDGGLEDNQIKFCPYCSGKIAAPKPESE